MIAKMLFSWAMAKVRGGHKESPSWDEIEQQLSALFAMGGFIRLTLEDEQGLQDSLLADGNQHAFLLTLNDQTTDKVRSYRNPKGSNERVEISGNCWTEWDVCNDPSIARQAFKEFFETGNVSRELLP